MQSLEKLAFMEKEGGVLDVLWDQGREQSHCNCSAQVAQEVVAVNAGDKAKALTPI